MGISEEGSKHKFKKSRLGKVPVDWHDVLFENIFEEVVEYTNDTVSYPLYSLTIENGVTPKTERYERGFLIRKDKDNYKIVNKDEFVYNPMNLRFGAISRLKEDKQVAVSAYYNVFKIKGDYTPEFIEYFLKSERMMYLYNAFATGSLIEKQRVHFSQFIKFKIPLPPINEANKIGNILSTWDKAIGLKEKLIEQKKEQKKGLMQKLLTGEVRLPGFEGEWKVVRIKDLSSVVTGTTPSTKNKDYYENGTYPWITPTDITDSKYISKSERKLTEKGIEKGRFVPAGSLLVTCIASIGKNAILTMDGSCNQQINAILPSKQHSNEFLYYKLKQDIKRMEILAGKSATAIINKSTFENFKISIPELEEQKAIAKVLSVIDESIELSLKEVEQLKIQKKGLKQLLLTGKVRVKV